METRKKINVFSLDFDGCVFNGAYINQVEQHPDFSLKQKYDVMFRTNENLINKITNDVKQSGASDVFFMVGSNRQSAEIDSCNAYIANKGSAYSALSEFKNKCREKLEENGHLGPVKVDNYLLADSFATDKREVGDTFRWKKYKEREKDPDYQKRQVKHMKESYKQNDSNPATWFFDDGKLTILYAQMHKMAAHHPDAEIVFNFYDDRGPDSGRDIETGLVTFFKAHPTLIPPNVTLHIHQYAGKEIKLISPEGGLKGNEQSQIDNNYGENIKRMIKLAGFDPNTRGENNTNVMQGLLKNNAVAVDEFINNRKLEQSKDPATLLPPVSQFLVTLNRTLKEDYSREGIGWFFTHKNPAHIVKLRRIRFLPDETNWWKSTADHKTSATEVVRILIHAKDHDSVLRSKRVKTFYESQLAAGLKALNQTEKQFREANKIKEPFTLKNFYKRH